MKSEEKETPKLQDYVRIFHENCGGIVVGPLDELKCAECGKPMTGFVSSSDEIVGPGD